MDTSTIAAETTQVTLEATIVKESFIERYRDDYDELTGAENEESYLTLYRLCSHSRQLPRIVAVQTKNKKL